MQRVQPILEMSDDESSASGPPDLEDLDDRSSDNDDDDNPPGLMTDSEDDSGSAQSQSNSMPSLQNYDEDSDMPDSSEEEDEHDNGSGPPEPSEDEGPPNPTGGDEEDQVPALDDPESGSDSASDEEMPSLEVDSRDASDDESDDNLPQWTGMQKGFLNANKEKKSSTSYSNAGVGQREEGAAAVAAARARAASNRSATYSGAGTGAFEEPWAEPHPYGRSKGGMTPDESHDFLQPGGFAGMPGPSSSYAARAQQWATNQPKRDKKKKMPEPAPSSEPAKPAEVVVDREAILAREREMEELRRRLQMAQDETNAAPLPVGRCCLNRALGDAPAHCLKDPITAQVWPAEKRMQMKCSAGCNIVWHQECWRRFQDGYEQEMRSDKENAHAGNIIQGLKIKDKTKPPLVHCVTPGCPGYINALGIFEGPPGHESFKNPLFGPSQEQIKLIKEAQEADLAAAKEAAAQARRELKQAAAAAALQAWRCKTNKKGEPNWKPKGSKKPRNKAQKPQQEQLANGTGAVSKRSGNVHDELMQFLENQGSTKNAAEPDAAAKAAEAVAAAAEKKSAGITVKRAIKPIVLRRQEVKLEEPEEVSSPTAASVEGSASANQSASLPASSKEPDPLEQLGKVRLSDHVDRTYHASVQDMVAQEIPAAAEIGKKGKKKKGITMHLDQLLALGLGQEPTLGSGKQAQQRQQQQQQQQQPQQPRLADFPSLDQAAAIGTQAVAAETDFLMEALNRLKIGMSETNTAPHVLIECVDFYMMRKTDVNPQQHLMSLIKSKTGEHPVYLWLFERQEAVAVTMSSTEKALLLYMYMNNYHLFRKPLKPSYLRQPPYDDVLHEVCPEYETPAMREQREQQEALQEAGVVGEMLPQDKMDELMNKVVSGAISGSELLKQIEEETKKHSQDDQQQHLLQHDSQQQQQQAESASSAAQAAAAAVASKKVISIVDPRQKQPTPPPPPSLRDFQAQQQQQQRGPPRVMYPQHMAPAVQQPFMMQPQPLLMPHMGYGMVPAPFGNPIVPMPALLPVMQPIHPVVLPGVMQQPQQLQQQTWQQQQQMLAAQRWQQPQQVAADGDWVGDTMISNEQGTSYWDGGHEVAIDQDEAEAEHESDDGTTEEQQQQQTQDSRGRTLSAALAGTDGARSMSGSPGIKLNPLAKEFKIPGAGTTPQLTRLQIESSSSSSAAAGSAAVVQSAIAMDRASSSSTATEPAPSDGIAVTAAAAASDDQAEAAVPDVLQQKAAAAESPPSKHTSNASSSTAAEPADSGSSADKTVPAAEPASQPEQQDPGGQPVAAEQSSREDGLPADHIFDVVHLAGCNMFHLQQTFRNPNVHDFTLPHGSFTDSHKIATRQSGGLVMYNVETHLVEGLWVACNNTAAGVQWCLVATYTAVPREVYAPVLQLTPFNNHYPGEQGIRIIRAIWDWAHPRPALAPTPALPLPVPGAADATSRSNSGSDGGALQEQQQKVVSAPSSRPTSSGRAAGADANSAGGRALPPLLAMLANRPGSAGNSSTGPAAATAAQPAAAPPAAAAPEAAPPRARAPARQQLGRKLCTICQSNSSGWLVFGCKHMGPCVECCPRPVTMTPQDKFYADPPEYPTCLFPGCNKAVKQLFRVVM